MPDEKTPPPGSEEDSTRIDDPSDTSTLALPPTKSPPSQIGAYKILEKIGEGGMGVVYLAEQERPLRRRVALKLVKLGMDTKQVLARFESERQALAIMNHPNIAKVHDAGSTEQGRPYFVMEYVKGIPITDYCDKHRLTNKERLKLFIPVCQAIHHAHQKGIIHRDVKPSNILVAVEDGRPIPKVIDFGVAKATSQQLTERTLFTQHGMLIGTPEYMSPEQAEMTGLDIDITTDIYSLGVVLYELLVGALPFEPRVLRKAGYDEMRRIIRETDPPRPSTRVSAPGLDSAEVARRRRTSLVALQRLLRGDLDWITMKAMEKDRTHRYGTVADFAEDINRHLRCKSVLAGPHGFRYRVRRYGRRNWQRIALFGVLVMAAIVVISVLITTESRNRRRDLRAISQTLNNAIAIGKSPLALNPDWERLQRVLQAEVGSAGELTELAIRATAHVRIDIPTFALLSDLPAMFFKAEPLIDGLEFESEFLYIADIYLAWDGADRKLITTLTKGRTSSRYMVGASLGNALLKSQLAPGPHRLVIDIGYWFYDSDEMSEAYHEVMELDRVSDGLRGDWLPEEARPVPLFKGTRRALSQVVSLFHEYPEGFPSPVAWDKTKGALTDWLDIRTIRVLRVILPEGKGTDVRFPTSMRRKDGEEITHGQSAPESRAEDGWYGGIVVGRAQYDFHTIPIPLAAEIEIVLQGAEQPIVRFPFYFGRDRENIPGGGTGVEDPVTGIIWMGHHPKLTQPLDPSWSDGTYAGVLRMSPSRDIALQTRKFDSFLGDRVTIPVEVQVITVDGWYE